MSSPQDAADALLETLKENTLDGFEPWREVGPKEWVDHAKNSATATAYLEIVDPREGDVEMIHAVADRAPVERPVFDDGAAADRAREIELDRELGVTP